jgi:hypothetical protein
MKRVGRLKRGKKALDSKVLLHYFTSLIAMINTDPKCLWLDPVVNSNKLPLGLSH